MITAYNFITDFTYSYTSFFEHKTNRDFLVLLFFSSPAFFSRFFSLSLIFPFLAFGCYVENIQVGHGDRSHGHDGLPVFGAKSYNEGYDSLTTNRPLLLLRMTERKKRMER